MNIEQFKIYFEGLKNQGKAKEIENVEIEKQLKELELSKNDDIRVFYFITHPLKFDSVVVSKKKINI